MKRHLPVLFLALCACGLTAGIIELFELRYEIGDVYPDYSSLRSDPLGTMAFYESLARVDGFSVERDLSISNHLPDGKGMTYVQIAARVDAWQQLSEETFSEIERFTNSGGRLVITLLSQRSLPSIAEPKDEKMVSVRDRWGLDFDIIDLPQGEDQAIAPAEIHNESGLPLPETIDWHSGIVFKDPDPSWRRIYTRGSSPVIIERRFGSGSIVFATDSYFLSNEAMLRDRQPELLAWLIGSSRNAVFDEAHLGVTEVPGVATLMRRYRLHGVIAALVLLAALFIWKNSVSLVPRAPESAAEEYVPGRDIAAGFVNLLRRGIPVGALFATCFTEWKKSEAITGKYSTVRMREVETAFEAANASGEGARDPVRSYRTISRILDMQNK